MTAPDKWGSMSVDNHKYSESTKFVAHRTRIGHEKLEQDTPVIGRHKKSQGMETPHDDE
jgi:hypothetical protein